MARKPRVHLKGYTQHVIQRGRNRELCFYAERDYQNYLDILHEAAKKTACDVHAYVLMSNHVHLLITPHEDYGISQMLKRVAQLYAQYINHNYSRTGTLWDGRYKSSVIDTDEYLLTCYKYIEMNPVRANMTQLPSQYQWSSARWHGLAEPNRIIVDHPLYNALGFSTEDRANAYRSLFREDFQKGDIDILGAAFSQGKVLGNKYFVQQLKQALINAGSDPALIRSGESDNNR